ncbi:MULTISPECIES: MIP/aquaporin family protein [Bacillus]|uniref:Major intrinsic protein n=3 Tax=Bacillus cereus group TaxID=86661 RepID=A9VIW4_BACMK|nr:MULTISPECIES: aquaporin [Bacillus cereus group]ABY45494.1 major intrinsic protein [Bacillus mycoides KBAB4]EJQ58119.1 MIP family channel protein [Bacillus mycoides]EJQ69651.1 MIP family channel protein [Bacillus mycoides]EJS07450.1 MIP family channel protein [Bacillus mycoides]EJV63362.1 MIP family channel protein [Bacillus mycoides]
MLKKAIAEFIGTFVLVLFGTGVAVIGGGIEGIGTLGIAMAFGLSIVAMAYSIGTISGCHINPAVSIAMFINKRMNAMELSYYLLAQILGGLLGTATLVTILRSAKLPLDNLGQNSFGTLGLSGAFLVEFILTFVFVLVIVAVTGKKGSSSLAGLVIGFTLVLIHLLGIPLTGTSVNPARSIAPALFAGGEALSQLWVFIVAPILGGIVAAIVGKFILNTEK